LAAGTVRSPTFAQLVQDLARTAVTSTVRVALSKAIATASGRRLRGPVTSAVEEDP